MCNSFIFLSSPGGSFGGVGFLGGSFGGVGSLGGSFGGVGDRPRLSCFGGSFGTSETSNPVTKSAGYNTIKYV